MFRRRPRRAGLLRQRSTRVGVDDGLQVIGQTLVGVAVHGEKEGGRVDVGFQVILCQFIDAQRADHFPGQQGAIDHAPAQRLIGGGNRHAHRHRTKSFQSPADGLGRQTDLLALQILHRRYRVLCHVQSAGGVDVQDQRMNVCVFLPQVLFIERP